MLYVLIFVLFTLCLVEFIMKHNILTPRFVFNGIWFISLFLYEFKLSYIQQDLSERTIVIFWICIISYNFSSLLFSKCNAGNMSVKFKLKKHVNVNKKIKLAKEISVIIFLLQILYCKGIPIVWKILKIHKTYRDFGIASVNGAFCGLIICLGAYSIMMRNKDFIIYISMAILMLNRQVIISMIVEGVVCIILSGKYINVLNTINEKINKKKIAIMIVVLFAIFTVMGNFRSGNDVIGRVFMPKEKYENLPSWFMWIYSYMTFSISNFNNLVSMTIGGINHGASMLKTFLPTVLLNIINVKEIYRPYFLVSIQYTVSTYLPAIYLDFGIMGIAIFNIIIAMWGQNIFNNLNKNNNIMVYSVFVHNIILLFFENMFLYLPVVIQFIYIPLIFNGNINNSCNVVNEEN